MPVALMVLAGCRNGSRPWAGLATDDTPPPLQIPAADTDSTTQPAFAPWYPWTRIDVLLRVLYVQVPRSERDRVAGIWDHLREDALDSETQRQLRRNGVRVGLGRTERWDTIRAALNSVAGHRVREFPPLRTPPGVPLALELDREPAAHTVFYADHDGILSGDTWPASRRALCVTYTLDTRNRRRVFLGVVPEIRQEREPQWEYGEGGWSAGPQRAGRAFAAAAFAVRLGANEFVLLAPGEKADLYGLVGGTFLTDKMDDEEYDSYVFLRTDITYVNQRH